MNGSLVAGERERERERESQLADKSQQRTAVPLHHIQLGDYSYSSIIKSESFIISAITTGVQHYSQDDIFLLHMTSYQIYSSSEKCETISNCPQIVFLFPFLMIH